MKKTLYTKNYTHYVLGALTVVYVFNFIDRQILAILAPAIRDDLGLSDTQIGALSGLAFGLFYATLGIPIARLADKYSRVNVISISLGVWSLMTALSGLATNFFQLLIARIGVGIGEAGGSPPSHSLIADYFSPESRSSALGVFALGVPIGILFGNLAGGWINEFFGWRNAFFLVGIPGIVLALIVKLSIKEPPRGYSEETEKPSDQVPFSEVLRTMWSFPSFRYIALGAGTQAFVGYGSIAWMPSFFVRTHDMSTGEIGTALGLIIGLFGGVATIISGFAGDYFGKKDKKYYMLIPAIAFLIAFPTGAAVFIVDSLFYALLIYTIPVFLVNLYTGPTFGMTQTLAPLAMRASASALMLFIVNFIGLVFGPTAVGFISDTLQASMLMSEVESLRWSLLSCNVVYLLSFLFYYLASKTIESDLSRQNKG
ncbi:MAG: spinster family MFS transporter [Candidatus Azotimanducaceae bacterium]